jgi:hypothetical protein
MNASLLSGRSTKLAAICTPHDEIDFLKIQLSLVPNLRQLRGELAKTALGVIVASAALVVIWLEAFWRHGL